MAVSGYLSAELAATCNALGFYDGQKYHLEPHCKETVRDLIRYLRRDEGGSHEIRRYLGNAKLLTTDLLPMVQCHHKDVQLFDIALRLIVNLTNPALLVYNEVIPTDKFEHNYYLEITSHLQQYKEAFNDHRSWAPFTERLSELLGKNVDDRSEDDQRTVERILILIRNILHVPSSADLDQRPDNDASIHDQVLWGLHQSGMIDLLLYISSSDQESLFFMHLLEIICLMLREQPADVLAKTASQRSAEEKNKDDEELLRIRQLELQNKMKKNKKYFGTRHSNFGGTFVIKNMKSTSDNNDLIYHKPVHDSKYISLDTEKKPVKLPKNRQPLKCESAERKSALSVRLILKQVCVEFLNAAYNPLMLHVRECFHRGRAQENDESYYFSAMRFFMEFNRHYKFQVKYVSETLSVQTFQFIQKYLETWHDMMTTDKKKLPLWSYRSHLALRAYKELLHNLAVMDRNEDESVRESSKVIKSNIFYVLEYREMLLTLVNLYKREKYSKKYLVDLLETLHIFIKLLCDYCKDKKMVIQKTAVRRKKKNKQKKSKSQAQDQASAETIWNLACDEVALTLTSNIECDVVPFDATLELDMDQQKLEAIKKIQFHLKNGDNNQAVAMLRASREVWPENDTFGTNSADTAEELEILKDIFLADLGNGNEIIFKTPFITS
uniref:Timeless N-terminal domain-containing protein n=2 Tax=Lygus hesperus TaxID=30085 RepID=A0A0A9ZGA5_LYGHE